MYLFVSYRTCDEVCARRAVEWLEQYGHKCWVSYRDVVKDYQTEIAQTIPRVDAVLIIMSRSTRDSAHVKKEASLGNKYNKDIIPILRKGIAIDDFKGTWAEYILESNQAIIADQDDMEERLLRRIRSIDGTGVGRGEDVAEGEEDRSTVECPENVALDSVFKEKWIADCEVPGHQMELGGRLRVVPPLDKIGAGEMRKRATRARKTQRCLMWLGFSFFLASVAGVLSWDANRTAVNYFADYVDSFGLPEGIFPLEKSELPRRQCHYRFEYRGIQPGKSPHADSAGWNIWKLFGGRRKLVRVVQANPQGRPFLWNLYDDQPASIYADRPSVLDFLYDRDARLREIRCSGSLEASEGKIFDMRIELSNTSSNDGTVTTNGLLEFYSAEGRLSRAHKKSESTSDVTGDLLPQKSSISKYHVFRDEKGQGRVVRCFFLDDLVKNVPDGDGLFGFEYAAYDDYGRPQVKWYLVPLEGGSYGRGINKIGVAGEKLVYSGRNLFQMKFVDTAECPVRGPYGWKVRENNVDEYGRLCRVLYMDENGKVECLPEGYAGYNAIYDESGNMVRLSYFDDSLNPAVSANGFARIYIAYDAKGNMRELSYRDPEGRPVFHKQGYAGRVLDVDADGALVRETYVDTNGCPVAWNDGYASMNTEYGTSEGGNNCKLESFFNAGGKPTVDIHGVAKCLHEYDELGNEIKVTYFGTNDVLALHKDGYAGWEAFFDERGNEISRRFFGLEGQFVVTAQGYAGWNVAFNNRGLVERRVIIGTDDVPMHDKDGVAEYRYDYDERGNVVRCSYFDVNGEPTLNSAGIAGWEAGYDLHGNMNAQWFFDTNWKLILRNEGYAGWQANYDDRKNKLEECYFDVDKRPVLTKDGYAYWNAVYDLHGNVVKKTYYDVDVKQRVLDNEGVSICATSYDVRYNLTGQSYYGTDGNATLNVNGIAGWSAKYDPRGNMTAQWFFGPDGKLIMNRDGCASLVAEYDTWGNKRGEWYFDVEGDPVLTKDGYASWLAEYDLHGNVTTGYQYGVDGMLAMDKDGVAIYVCKYDELNNQIKGKYYGVDGRPTTNKYGIAEFRAMYDNRCNQMSRRLYGLDGKLTLNEDGSAGWDAEHDVYGHETRSINVGLDGKAAIDKYGVMEWRTEYDKSGNITNTTYLGLNGKPVQWRQTVEIVAVSAGSPGAKNGMRKGDIWCRFGTYDILESPNAFLVDQQQPLVNSEKELVVARKVGDRYEIRAAHFPVGLTGIVDDVGKTVDYEKIVAAYQEYCEKGQTKSK